MDGLRTALDTLPPPTPERVSMEGLYDRHAGAAWGLAHTVTGDDHDAAESVAEAFRRALQASPAGGRVSAAEFRPALLAAVRQAAFDRQRRAGRLGGLDVRRPTVRQHSPAAQAFRELPERWRSVLWLSEVERMAPVDVAIVMGVAAEAVAQLVVRARAGFEERYLQVQLGHQVRPGCHFAVRRLGSYLAGGLPARDMDKLDQHLASCADCRRRLADLVDLPSTLAGSVPPLPPSLHEAVTRRWQLATSLSGPRPQSSEPSGRASRAEPQPGPSSFAMAPEMVGDAPRMRAARVPSLPPPLTPTAPVRAVRPRTPTAVTVPAMAVTAAGLDREEVDDAQPVADGRRWDDDEDWDDDQGWSEERRWGGATLERVLAAAAAGLLAVGVASLMAFGDSNRTVAALQRTPGVATNPPALQATDGLTTPAPTELSVPSGPAVDDPAPAPSSDRPSTKTTAGTKGTSGPAARSTNAGPSRSTTAPRQPAAAGGTVAGGTQPSQPGQPTYTYTYEPAPQPDNASAPAGTYYYDYPTPPYTAPGHTQNPPPSQTPPPTSPPSTGGGGTGNSGGGGTGGGGTTGGGTGNTGGGGSSSCPGVILVGPSPCTSGSSTNSLLPRP